MSTAAMLESPMTDDKVSTTTSPKTLFDLIATMQDNGEPGEEYLIVPTLVHLFESRRVTWKAPAASGWSHDDA
jgi:hypothetical protein